MAKGKHVVSVTTVEQAVELLTKLANGEKALSVSALARKTGISRYKTMRLLAILEQKGVVRPAVGSGKHGALTGNSAGRARAAEKMEPEPEPVSLKLDDAVCLNIVAGARPVLESLARRHHEAIYLTILNGNEVLLLDVVDGHCQVQAEPLVGRRFPFFNNAAGKVMRAIDSWDLLERLVKRWSGGPEHSPDLTTLHAELELIREKGVAVDCNGMGEGIITVAVAVRDYAGKVVGALMMLGPSFRLIGERLEEEIIPSLLSSGEMLSMKFGYLKP